MPNLSELKQQILSSRSCLDIFNFDLGIHVRSEGQCILAPSFIRSERNPSFAVYSDHCFDFTTHTYYSLLDIYALYKFGDTSTESICKAAELLSGQKLGSPHSQISDSFVSQQQAFNIIIDEFHNNLLANPIINPEGKDIHALDYFTQRRISLDTIKALKIGWSGHDGGSLRYMHDRLIFPYFLHGTDNPVYANGRAAKPVTPGSFPKYKKLALDDDRFNLILKNHIWGLHTQDPARTVRDSRINPDTGEKEILETHHVKYDYLVVSEGVFDTLAFAQEGYQLASSLGCGFSQEQKKELVQSGKHYAEKGKKVFLCLDNDKAGDRGQYDIALLLFKNRIPFVVGQLPRVAAVTYDKNPNVGQEVSIKDVSDYYAAGGDLADLFAKVKPGVSILAEHCKNEQELEALFLETAKLASKSDLIALKRAALSVLDDNGQVESIDKSTGEVVMITDYKPRFDKFTVNAFYSLACQPLQDKIISDMTCKAHQLMYDTSGQFYEYSAGIWRAVHDLIIQRYIADTMGGNISSNKISNVFKYLKISTAVQALQFNTKPLWCFRNGTLWLDEDDKVGATFMDEKGKCYTNTEPKNFKPSMPDDMASIQLPFDYRYGVKNEAWLRYISQWTAGKEDKALLLQEMTGYVLYAANTLQKFFYLIGDGANGKSTFLHTIENVFGKDNCSSLQFHRFGSEFDTIALKNSRLNICYDARTELGNAEDILKAISSGDSIMAAHKGVDAEAFTTNAKIFVAANRFFSASDTSKGLLRRILFVCFDQDFSGEGQKFDIEDEIKNDPAGLAGVFNWAYEGYKRLKASGKFTETEEQKRLVEEFKTQLSPLMVFARECMYNRYDAELSEANLYAVYKEWCIANGEKRLSRTKFIYEIRQVLRTDGRTEIITERVADMWAFRFPHWEGDEEEDEGLEEVQSKEAPANERPAPAHSGKLSGNEGTNQPEPSENRKPLPQKKPKVTDTESRNALKKDPAYIHNDKPFAGMTNQQIWDFGKRCVIELSRRGRYWKELARAKVQAFRVYGAIDLYSDSSKEASDFVRDMLPGFTEFLFKELLPNFEIADDDVGTLIPIQNDSNSEQEAK